jgi:2-methylcitrate dehydratase PrpD
MKSGENVTPVLADFVAAARFEHLPAAAIHEAKRLLLDSIGCALAGLTSAKGRLAVRLAQRLGGTEESVIWGTRGSVSATHAAFANGELINALDWDAGGVPPGHSTPCVISACFALGETCNASGQDLLLAIALGHEISGRLGGVLTGLEEWTADSAVAQLPPVHGYSLHAIGAAAAAARILGLGPTETAWAFGIGAYFAPVPAMVKWYKTVPAAMTKYGSTGWIAQAGVTAALLAQSGYSGDTTVLDGEHGFWRFCASAHEKWQPGKLLEGLGQRWLLGQPYSIFYKHYPFCGLCHVEMDEFLDIVRTQALRPEEIDSVRILCDPLIEEPIWVNTNLQTHVDAQFSVPFIFAVAAHGIRIGAQWQDETLLHDERIKAFMPKVTMGTHPAGLHRIEVRARGQCYEAECEARMPVMSDAQLITKFEQNAALHLPSPAANRILKLVLELETLAEITELTRCLEI